MFGYISGATISDIGLSNVAITAGDGSTYAGSLAGYNDGGTLTGVYSAGTVSGGANTGGLVGYNTGTITKSYSVAAVSGTGNAGGLGASTAASSNTPTAPAR